MQSKSGGSLRDTSCHECFIVQGCIATQRLAYNGIRRYLRLYAAFVRNCLRFAAEFRANFWANIITNFGWMLSLVILLSIIYHNTKSVAGWSEPQMFVLFGTYTVLRGISNMLFYGNLSQLPTFIRMGTMDYILTKPVNSQFYVSMRYLEFEDIGQSVGGVFVILYGVMGLHTAAPHFWTVAAFVVMLLASMVIFYSLTMLLMTLSFWLIRLDNLMVLSDTVFQIARTPIDIFGAFGPLPRFLLTYVLPLAFIATMPVKVLFERLDPAVTAGSAVGIAALCFICSALFWRYATRAYSSASS